MSDDLISRKAVMDYLREQQADVIMENAKENPSTYEATKGMKCSIDAFMNFIVTMPTAYDLDKVVEQLKKQIGTCEMEDCEQYNGDCDVCRAGKAIEIVKAGGVNE